jgi:hypothetical protein
MNDFLNLDGSRGVKPEKKHGHADPLFIRCTEERFAVVGVGVNRALAAAVAQDREAVALAENPETAEEQNVRNLARPALSVVPVPDYAPPLPTQPPLAPVINIDEARAGVEAAVTPDPMQESKDELESKFEDMGWTKQDVA